MNGLQLQPPLNAQDGHDTWQTVTVAAVQSHWLSGEERVLS